MWNIPVWGWEFYKTEKQISFRADYHLDDCTNSIAFARFKRFLALMLECFMQPHLGSQAQTRLAYLPLTTCHNRLQHTFGFLLRHLYFANAGNVNPFAYRNLVSKRLQIEINHLRDQV